MKLTEAYQALTEEAKRQAVKDIAVVCETRRVRASEKYIGGVLRGCREQPCSSEVARIISGHFQGHIGIKVSVDEVLCAFSKKDRASAAQATAA